MNNNKIKSGVPVCNRVCCQENSALWNWVETDICTKVNPCSDRPETIENRKESVDEIP